MIQAVINVFVLQSTTWLQSNGRLEPVSIAALLPRKPNFNTVLANNGRALFLDHNVRFRFAGQKVDYLSMAEARSSNLRMRAFTRNELSGTTSIATDAYRVSGQIQAAFSEEELLVIHTTSLQVGDSDKDAPRRSGISKVTIGGDWVVPVQKSDPSQPITKYLPGMFGLKTLVVRRTPTGTFRLEVREGAKRLFEMPIATQPGFVGQFDDKRLRALARVKSQGAPKFGIDLVDLRPFRRTRLPAYPLTRSLGPVAFLRDGRILAAFSVKVGNDPKIKGKFPGATDEIVRDVIALYDPGSSKWQKVYDGSLWCSSATGSVLLLGDENPKGKQWLFWPKGG